MMYDCIIIGSGPAGLSAGLVLGRANLNVLIIDDAQPRNKVVSESHGFITNDSISPVEIRKKASNELIKYPTIQKKADTVIDITSHITFTVKTKTGEYHAKRIIIATGLKEILPEINGLKELYGKIWFNCPFCDGWEMKDKSLGIIAENTDLSLHLTKMVFHWNKHISLFTNGNTLSNDIRTSLRKNHIPFYEQRIKAIKTKDLQCTIYLEDQKKVSVDGGFLMPQFTLSLDFAKQLNLKLNELGRIETDEFGRTSQKNIYAAGDINSAFAEQLVHAASFGSKVAAEIVKELAFSNFK